MRLMQERKAPIRAFMQTHYTDERLAALLAHAKDGKLSYWSCCCFLGAANAPHPLQTEDHFYLSQHCMEAFKLSGGGDAHFAYASLGSDGDSGRRRILIPMIRAEMKRREKLREGASCDVVHAEVVAQKTL